MTTAGGSTPSAASLPADGSSPEPVKPRTRLPGLLLVLGSLLLYLPTLWFGLIYDDYHLIGNNSTMTPVAQDWTQAFDFFTREYWDGVNPELPEELRTRGQALYRPLTLFAWGLIVGAQGGAFQTSIEGMPALAFHLLNILVNAWVVWLFFKVLVRLFGNTRMAFLAAAVFALHPLHSEAVAYVAGLSDMVAAGFVLLGLDFYLKATQNQDRMAKGAYLGMLAALFVGLLSKETGVLIIAVVALTDIMSSLLGQSRAAGRRLAIYGGSLAVLAAHVLIRYLAMGYLQPNPDKISRLDNPLVKEATDIRVLNSFKVMARYVWLNLWPQDLSVDYSFNSIPVSRAWTDPEPLAGLVLVVALTVVGLMQLRRWPAFGWGLLLFTGTMAFTSNLIVPIGTIMGERLMYLPSLGMCLVGGFVLDRLLGSRAGTLNPVGLVLSAVIIVSLGARTWERNKDFESALTVFEAANEIVPDSARVHFQLGSLYAQSKLFAKAVEQYEASLADDDSFIPAALKLGEVHLNELNFDKAIETFDRILASMRTRIFSPDSQGELAALQAMVLTSRAQAKRGKGDLEGARADLDQARGMGIEGVDADIQLANVLIAGERWPEAISVLNEAIASEPDNVQLLRLLVQASIRSGDLDSYQTSLDRLKQTERGRGWALSMEAEVMYENGVVSGERALRDQAMDLFDEAAALDDSLAGPYIYRGLYMVETARAYYDAIIEYDRALERTPLHPEALLYKGEAQLAVNQPNEALATLRILEQAHPNEATYSVMAQVMFALGDVEGLEEVTEKIRALGADPLELFMQRAITYSEKGDPEKALEVVYQAMVSPEYAEHPLVLRQAAILLYDLGRYDEALATLEQQEQASATLSGSAGDPYLPINKARALLALGRDMEAGAQLELVEQVLATDLDPETMDWVRLRVSLLQWRSELFLREGGLFESPEEALALLDEGIQLTGRRLPDLFDLSLLAYVSLDRLDDALQRAQEGAAAFPSLPRYELFATALALAADGDRAAAVATLRAAEDDDPMVERLAARLES